MTVSLFTIGYEGLDPNQFLAQLIASGIGVVIDVRERASSRKPGFAKSALAEALAAHDIKYLHFRSLGCPKAIRYRYREDGDWAVYSDAYRAYLRTQTASLSELARLAAAQTCVLLCFEADAMRCHRRYVAARAAEQVRERVNIEHLTPGR